MTVTETEQSKELALSLYVLMIRIRAFEEKVQALFKLGKLPGFVHLYIGQEAVAVGACSVLRDGDRITSTHRGHGHLIAKGADVGRMMAELFGRRRVTARGRVARCTSSTSGSAFWARTGSSAAGCRSRPERRWPTACSRDNVTVAFFGDGAANQGVLHEALNLSAIWSLPVIYLCENNQYTEWMRTEDITAGRIADRAHAFGIPGVQVDGNDVFAIRDTVRAGS